MFLLKAYDRQGNYLKEYSFSGSILEIIDSERVHKFKKKVPCPLLFVNSTVAVRRKRPDTELNRVETGLIRLVRIERRLIRLWDRDLEYTLEKMDA